MTGTRVLLRPQVRLIALCCAALLVPLFLPLLTGRVFTKDDLAALHLPFRYLYREALRAGDSFLWTPAYRSGLYLYGEGEAGMAHPLHLLLYRFLPLGPAFNLEIISTYIAMLMGTGLLLRRLELRLLRVPQLARKRVEDHALCRHALRSALRLRQR